MNACSIETLLFLGSLQVLAHGFSMASTEERFIEVAFDWTIPAKEFHPPVGSEGVPVKTPACSSSHYSAGVSSILVRIVSPNRFIRS